MLSFPLVRSCLLMAGLVWSGVFVAQQAVGAEELPELETVESVDIQKYLGSWYEIARFDHSFERGCRRAKATYSLRDDGDIKVVNECEKDSFWGGVKQTRAEARAWVVDKTSNAKLKVRFFWPFTGNYWIIDLDPDYQYAVISEPKREYFWILSRTPQIEKSILEQILHRARAKGLNMDQLIWVEQP